MVKKVQKRGRPCKKKCVVKRSLRACRAQPGPGTSSGSGSGTNAVTPTNPAPAAEPFLLPCPSLRRVSNDVLPRMCAVRDCKDEESGTRALGGEDLDALQLELESLLSSVAVRLSQLNEQLTVLNGLETSPSGRGRKQRNTRTVIPAPAVTLPQPPPDDKTSISRPPVKAPNKKLGNAPPSGPSPGFSHPPRKRSKIIRKRPDEDESTTPQGKQLERDFVTHKFWNTLDPYCCEVTEDSYNLLSDILCRNQTDVPALYDIPPLGEPFAKEWDIKDFGENQDLSSTSPAVSSSSTSTSRNAATSNVTLSSATESFGNAIRRKFRECSIALKRTLRTTADKVPPPPSSPPPTPATSKLMAALLGEIPPLITPLQESKDHNVIVKVEREDDEKLTLKTSRPNSVSGSSSNSEILRKHQRRCLERKLCLEKEAQGDIELSIRDSDASESLLEELKRTQSELKIEVDQNSRAITNLANIIIEEFKIQNLKRKLQEVDDVVINIYHTRTAAKLAKQTISQDDVDQAWRALKERDYIIRQIDFFERKWTLKNTENVCNSE